MIDIEMKLALLFTGGDLMQARGNKTQIFYRKNNTSQQPKQSVLTERKRGERMTRKNRATTQPVKRAKITSRAGVTAARKQNQAQRYKGITYVVNRARQGGRLERGTRQSLIERQTGAQIRIEKAKNSLSALPVWTVQTYEMQSITNNTGWAKRVEHDITKFLSYEKLKINHENSRDFLQTPDQTELAP